MSQLDERPSLRRHYYRRVRMSLLVAGAIHVVAFAMAPPYRPATRPMRAEPIRLVTSVLGWGASAAPVAIAAPGEPGGGGVSGGQGPALAGVLQSDETSEVQSEQAVGAGGVETTNAGEVAPGLGGGGTGGDEPPPTYYDYDSPPRAIRSYEPPYPTMARESGQEGTVVVNVNLDERGKILRAWVASANAPEMLVAAALEAVYQFEFAPGTLRGRTVRTTVAIPFRFYLNKVS